MAVNRKCFQVHRREMSILANEILKQLGKYSCGLCLLKALVRTAGNVGLEYMSDLG